MRRKYTPQLLTLLSRNRPELEALDYSRIIHTDNAQFRGAVARHFVNTWLAGCNELQVWEPQFNGYQTRADDLGVTIYDHTAICTLDYFREHQGVPFGIKVKNSIKSMDNRRQAITVDLLLELDSNAKLVIFSKDLTLPSNGVYDGTVYHIPLGYGQREFTRLIDRLQEQRL